MIIDFHCHGGKGDLMTAPWNSAARLDLYFKRAAQAGIAKTVLLPAFHSDYRQANEQPMIPPPTTATSNPTPVSPLEGVSWLSKTTKRSQTSFPSPP